MQKNMRAIVLSAGVGTRMSEISSGLPKGFLKIGSETIIQRQIRLLKEAGIFDITLIVGYKKELFKSAFGDLNFIENPKYESTNTSYSLFLGLKEDETKTVFVLNGDVFFDENIIKEMVKIKNVSSLAAVDHKRNGEEEIKVIFENNRITAIGKYINEEISFGEAFGIYKFSPKFARYLRRELKLLNNPALFYEEGIDKLLKGGHVMNLYDIGNKFEIELDIPEDYYELLERIK
jgi:choline kinase